MEASNYKSAHPLCLTQSRSYFGHLGLCPVCLRTSTLNLKYHTQKGRLAYLDQNCWFNTVQQNKMVFSKMESTAWLHASKEDKPVVYCHKTTARPTRWYVSIGAAKIIPQKSFWIKDMKIACWPCNGQTKYLKYWYSPFQVWSCCYEPSKDSHENKLTKRKIPVIVSPPNT